MTNNYTLIQYHLSSMVEMLMQNYGISYEEALPQVMSSKTYCELMEKPFLQEEGKLFNLEKFQQEIDSKAA